MTKESALESVWDYLQLNHQLQKADVILGLGSNDIRSAARATELFQDGWAPHLMFTGDGTTHEAILLNNPFGGKTEAEAFQEVALAAGVEPGDILLETKASNTEQNFTFSKPILATAGIECTKVIVATKTPMERRAYATGKNFWPDVELIMTSPSLTFEEYLSEDLREDDVINIMLGDLERIKEYPARGFQIEQDIPEQVWTAFEYLVSLGYDKHLLQN